MINFTKRSIIEVILLSVVTFGIYGIYWAVVTKRELVLAGGNIPNAFLILIPFANFYFWYRYAQSYVGIVRKSQNETDVIVYFLIIAIPFLHLVGMAILQNGFNEYRA